jgi:hypothetical protein
MSRVRVDFDGRGEVSGYELLPFSQTRLSALRRAAAVALAPKIDVCEALLAGVPVPAHRLDQGWVATLGLPGYVSLDTQLALRVSAHGPLSEAA